MAAFAAPSAIRPRLHEAIAGFGRFVRQAGCNVGTGEILAAVEAASCIEVTRREDFKSALRATLVSSQKLIPAFDQLFDLYWRNPDRLERVSDILRKLYESRLAQAELDQMRRRRAEELRRRVNSLEEASEGREGDEQAGTVLMYSPEEVLREKRFDAYTEEELAEAKKFLDGWRWEFGTRRVRRLRPGSTRHRLNLRKTIRENIFPTQDFVQLSWRERRTKPRPLVVLCDISGSMEPYTRILMHFAYVLHTVHSRLEAFTFGTRLTRITHYLRRKDVSDVMELVGASVKDWSGGTRIGESLEAFNLLWARRLLGRGAVVVVISDGWDTGDVRKLGREMDRLHKSCHRLIWLNPNLGFEGFQPLTSGLLAIMPHVDDFLSVHNLNCLAALGKVLATLDRRRFVAPPAVA